jgi:hypothetical protein
MLTARFVLPLFFACAVAFAAEKPIGTLISSDPFEINGVRFGAAGVYSWPVFALDRIKTESSMATIYLLELGELSLNRDSTLQLDIGGSVASANLLNGQMGFSLSPHSRLRVMAADRSAGSADSPGVISRFGERAQLTAGSSKIPGASLGAIPASLPSAGRYVPVMARTPAIDSQFARRVLNLVAAQRTTNSRFFEAANIGAHALVSGGSLFLGNSESPNAQRSFFYEGTGRAGGLMAIRQYTGTQSLHKGDLLWIAYAAGDFQSTAVKIAEAEKIGAVAVAFGPRPPKGVRPFSHWIDSLTAWNDDEEFTLFGNVLSFWSMTGELAAATSRMHKTLVFWQSISVPGSAQRNARYAGSLFHGGPPFMSPTAAGVFSARYLEYTAGMLNRILTKEALNIEAIRQAVERQKAARRPVTLVSNSHLIPFLTSAAHNPAIRYLEDRPNVPFELPENGLLIDIGYGGVNQRMWSVVRQTRGASAVWIVDGDGAEVDPASSGDLAAGQQWKFGDCTVDAPGYDTCILPASGIAQLFYYKLLFSTQAVD